MLEPQKMTERQKLCRNLARARKFHKDAVRWLFDTSRLANMYEAGDYWRGDINRDIADVARKTYDDAVKEVIQTRNLVDKAAKELKEYDENE